MKTINNVKKRIIISMIAILLLIITIFGITYAYFSAKIKENQDESIEVTSGKLELTYNDMESIILVDNILPNTTLKEKIFSVKNTGTRKVDSYDVYLQNVINELKYYEDLTYTLICTSDIGNCQGNEGVFPKYDETIVTNSIEIDETQTYKLIVTYNESYKDQSDDMKKQVSAKVNIKDDEKEFIKLNIYGNTTTTLANGATDITPNTPATLTSLGSLVTDKTDSNYGKYKINITSSSKNLFNINNIDNSNYNISSSSVSLKLLATNSSTSTQKTLIELCPGLVIGHTYTLSYKSVNNAKISLGTFTEDNIWENNTSKTLTEQDLNSIVIMGENENTSVERNVSIDFIQLEEGNVSTKYEPYKEFVTKSVYINEPLRCVNETCDYIDLIEKKVYRNIGKVIYNENESFSITSGTYWNKDGVTTAFMHPIPSDALTNNFGMPVISNMFTFDSTQDEIDNTKPYISGNSNQIVFALNNTTASSVNELQSFLSNNNLEIIYPLATTNNEETVLFSDTYYLINKIITVTDGTLSASKIETELE